MTRFIRLRSDFFCSPSFDKARYTDWDRRDDIKAELKADLIILLAEHGYPPVDRDEVYKEIFEQAENFKKYQTRVGA
ncbi:type I restriction enzyme endonuclease domain-containing protein [Desulfonatronovibrio magnus]|uniref:type I restriction enzyme endonuclease domain-containing protein n=1 Tax=Desulfonatronovibrio magnus TaxID=698827 RepID=UPI0005EB98AA